MKSLVLDWGRPENFVWLWSIPAILVAFGLSAIYKKYQIRRFGDLKLVEKLISSLDPMKRLLKRLCFVGAILCMVLALAQPHFSKKNILVERKGIDVMIAVDVSQSMLAKDILPSRLEKAKLELNALIDRLKSDRIGIVAFAGEAFIQCPLTLDRGAVKLFLSAIGPNLIPTPGTALANAILVAMEGFTSREKESRAIILLTDGEDQNSDPLQVARRAKEEGVRIFTIGIGTPDGSTLPNIQGQEGFKKDREGQIVISKLGETLLRRIAEETGGAYYRSTRGELEIDSLVKRMDAITEKALKSEWTVEYQEHFQWLLFLALIFLFCEMVISERRGE